MAVCEIGPSDQAQAWGTESAVTLEYTDVMEVMHGGVPSQEGCAAGPPESWPPPSLALFPGELGSALCSQVLGETGLYLSVPWFWGVRDLYALRSEACGAAG